MSSNCVLVPLVDRLDLKEECVRLINEEWPKSHSARLLSVERGANHEPPMAFVLLETSENRLIGYGRFLRILNYRGRSALFDTIVIRREFRGHGYGRVMMNLLKEEAISRDYELLIVSTEDKEPFYEKCGYARCKFLNLLTSNIGQSGRLSDSMRFERPIPIESKIPQTSEVETSTSVGPQAPTPPQAQVKLKTSFLTQYMFCYVNQNKLED